MGRVSVCGTAPASSTGSPTTLMMRPRVPAPTGTEIAWPVSVTSWPRTRPSVVSMAMVRTVDSPRCCATSSTSRLPLLLVSSALRIGGSSPSNCTSTTAPITCEMRPVLLADLAMLVLVTTEKGSGGAALAPVSQRLGAGDDLDQLLGDHRLARAVVLQRAPADHVAGISGGIVHRRHARALLGSGILEQRPEHLHREIARQQPRQDLRLIRLELIDRAAAGSRRLVREDRRDHLLRRRDLRDHRLEAGEEQGGDIEGAAVEQLYDLLGDRLGIDEAEHAHRAQLDHLDDLPLVLALELVIALASDAQELDVLAVRHEPVGALAGEADDRRVEAAAQPALGG